MQAQGSCFASISRLSHCLESQNCIESSLPSLANWHSANIDTYPECAGKSCFYDMYPVLYNASARGYQMESVNQCCNGDLTGRTALVTGAARGMGMAIALELGSRGARLLVNDVHAKSLKPVLAALTEQGCSATAIPGDITNPDVVQEIFRDIESTAGGADIVVNNAGILRSTTVDKISFDEWNLVIKVNLTGTFLVSQAALPSMIRKGCGRIVNLSSTAGKNVSTLGGAHYTASKAGVLGITRHFAKEVAGNGITVNAVCPGLIATDMVRETIDSARVARYAAGFPIHRLGQPEEVASLVGFLCSDKAAYITGASLDINGGDLMI